MPSSTRNRRTHRRMSELWASKRTPTLPWLHEPVAIISDLHLGDGTASDDFRRNEHLMVAALGHYAAKGFRLVLLGDIEEFWQYDLDQIVERYDGTIYEGIRAFGDDRVVRIWGNHDTEWAIRRDPAKNAGPVHQFAYEAVRLAGPDGEPRVMLVHGHQGSSNADKSSWISRFFVRLFRPMKPMAKRARIFRRKSTTRAEVTKTFERRLYAWAKRHGAVVVCGHTHRAIFGSRSYAQHLGEEIRRLERHPNPKSDVLERLRQELSEERRLGRDVFCDPEQPANPVPCYFNSGCAVYTDGMTLLELSKGSIRLVKWHWIDGEPIRDVYRAGDLDSILEKVAPVKPDMQPAGADQSAAEGRGASG